MRVLVTGAGGFVGPVVAAALRAAGHEVHGLVRRQPAPARLAGVPVTLHEGDLLAPGLADAVIRAVVPDAVVHLAGLAFVPDADRAPDAALRANRDTIVAVVSALRSSAPRARLLAVSSCVVYGAVDPGDLPVTEDVQPRPVNAYGESKLAAERVALGSGLDVVVARPFNHTGPGQSPTFVCAALARQVAAIERGEQEPVLRAGNVDAVRDFSDVRDIAAGYVRLLERGLTSTIYNLCSGSGVSVAEVIAILRSHARVPIRVRSDPALRRATDVPRIVGSFARAERDTGWRPAIPLEETLRATLADWRDRTGRTSAEKP
jgi:GDP-4-dehydro-6-deoxy-D-mannose reductase